MLLAQYRGPGGRTRIVARQGTECYDVRTEMDVYALAFDCIAAGRGLQEGVLALGLGEAVDLDRLAAEARLLPPLLHPDPAHLHLTGTGPPHPGGGPDRSDLPARTDAIEVAGDRSEWVPKGNGVSLVPPGAPLIVPGFAEDGVEGPEIAGLYVIAPDGRPVRLGFALANVVADHAAEEGNRLPSGPSDPRSCSIGPELLLGDLPDRVEGEIRIRRGDGIVFAGPFRSGEENLSQSIADLEQRRFADDLSRRPGDVHVVMFGAATPSSPRGIPPRDGDVVETEAGPFGLPLRNPLRIASVPQPPPRLEIEAL